MDKNAELFELSKKLVPGGVHSPVRSFKGLPMSPRFFTSSKGAYLYDIEDKSYIDFCMSFGPLVLGHKDHDVEKELVLALERGWTYGACEPYSLELAKFLVEKISFIDQVRFVNSGTEAVMTALRLARGATGRNKIIKFNGCYHGHTDAMLIKAGSGLAGTSEASSKGIPPGVAADTLIVELGDLEGVKACFKQYEKQIAAIIIEPLPANNGLLIQDLEFLKGLREITKENQSLLIFDEVISGFRVGIGGMSERLGITPDLVTYGKVIGGGLPVGAVAGPKHIMENLAPVGEVYQAGTLSANPLAMVGGLATLRKLTPAAYEEMNSATEKIKELFEKWLAEYNNGQFSNYKIKTYSSLFWFVPTDKEIKNIKEIPTGLGEQFAPLFSELLSRGIYISPNAYEVGFISMAHNSDVISKLKKRLFD
ncbi:MAG: aminotransferase class III-fold pyridoxal phosphate-dependent enzyme [Deltaproteobacteria bacterium]|nr:MAG: aminotransferase class III-fold pyridoxal phosphate-dependent enzyme [Deltaproteobacteria bacterium]